MKPILSLLLASVAFFAATTAHAFCGFYVGGADAKLFNNATQVVLMREGTRTVLSMQNNYEGPPSNFAMVVPVPVVLQKENVKTLPKDVFAKIDTLAAPRLVEYWEQDPCYQPRPEEESDLAMAPRAAGAPPVIPEAPTSLGVKVEARFEVGEYEIVILSAKDASGLETWLKEQKYKIPDGAAPYFKPYIQSGSKFFVAKVNVEKVKFEKGMAMLSPLRFHYDTETFSLPVRLGLMNAKGAQDLIVHLLGKATRYEVANYPNVTIPTNYDVAEKAKGDFGAFYAALFDKTLEVNPKAVVTEYAWQASSCDPCPGPVVDFADLLTLGGDVMPSLSKKDASLAVDWVLTRLHARYTKENLGDDLVFRVAAPIVGGREAMGADGKLEHGARPDSINNFQGRYAVRHPWNGPMACENPRRGVWGGPPVPAEGAIGSTPRAATNTAFATRGTPLASYMRSAIPELKLDPQGAAPSPVGPATPDPLRTAPPGTSGRGANGRCGCTSTGDPGSIPAGIGLGLVTLTLVRRIGRRRNGR